MVLRVEELLLWRRADEQTGPRHSILKTTTAARDPCEGNVSSMAGTLDLGNDQLKTGFLESLGASGKDPVSVMRFVVALGLEALLGKT